MLTVECPYWLVVGGWKAILMWFICLESNDARDVLLTFNGLRLQTLFACQWT